MMRWMCGVSLRERQSSNRTVKKNMPKLRNGSKGDLNPAHLIASPAFYHRATALHRCSGCGGDCS